MATEMKFYRDTYEVQIACGICGEPLYPWHAVCVSSPLKVDLGGGVWATDSLIVCLNHSHHPLLDAIVPARTRQIGRYDVYRRAEALIRHANGRPPINQRLPPVRSKISG